MLIRRKLCLSFTIAAIALLGSVARADTYPSRPIKIVVPYAPGGATDAVARAAGARITEATGQAVVIDNRPGAGGIAGAEIVARSPADGYTLLLSDIQQLGINPFLFSKLPYQPVRDFAPVTLFGSVPLYLMVPTSMQVSNLAELAALSKSKTVSLAYGSSGVGSIHHISMETMKSSLGMDVIHVPYKGTAPSVAAFMSGEVQMVLGTLGGLNPVVKTGKGKLIAITSLNRSPLTPEVPPVSDLIPGYDFSSEIGLVAPAGTSPEILAKLSRDIAAGMKNPVNAQKVGTTFNDMGMTLIMGTPTAYSENIKANLVRFEKAVLISGAKAD